MGCSCAPSGAGSQHPQRRRETTPCLSATSRRPSQFSDLPEKPLPERKRGEISIHNLRQLLLLTPAKSQLCELHLQEGSFSCLGRDHFQGQHAHRRKVSQGPAMPGEDPNQGGGPPRILHQASRRLYPVDGRPIMIIEGQ